MLASQRGGAIAQLEQNGSGNSITLGQAQVRNLAYVSQSGSGNADVINQR